MPEGEVYAANVKVCIYAKVAGGKFSCTDPVRTFPPKIHHTVAE